MATLVNVTERLQAIQTESDEAQAATRGRGIQSQLMRQQVRVLEVIATQVAALNENFVEFMEMQRMLLIKALDPPDVPVTQNRAGSPGSVNTAALDANTKAVQDQQEAVDDLATKLGIAGILTPLVLFREKLVALAKAMGRFGLMVARFIPPITALTGFIESFTEEEGSFADKIRAGIQGAIEKVIEIFIAWPSQLLVNTISWVARQLGFEDFANYLDNEVDVNKLWQDIFASEGWNGFFIGMQQIISDTFSWIGKQLAKGRDFISENLGVDLGNILPTGMQVEAMLLAVRDVFFDIFRTLETGEAFGSIKIAGEKIDKAVTDFVDLMVEIFDTVVNILSTSAGNAADKFLEVAGKSALGADAIALGEGLGDALFKVLNPEKAAALQQANIDAAMREVPGPAMIISAPTSADTTINQQSTNIVGGTTPARDGDAPKMAGAGGR